MEYYLGEVGFYQALEDAKQFLPEDLRSYVSVDTKLLASDWEMGMYVTEAEGGGVWVFEVRR